MFNNISWFQYLAFISIASFTWWATVFYIYYRHDLLQILLTKKTDHSGDGKYNPNLNFQQEHIAGIKRSDLPTSPDVSQIIQSFTDEVSAYLEEAIKNEVAKEDLLASLCRIANKFPSLAASEFKESLNQFIVNQTETCCAMFLSEEDLNKVWGET
ncbi:MAG TPA: hypothetical protein VFU29_08455 [Chitinophagaceae bacterium]|nr:hypothetical protein [Chitinophagaceae bacterium]